MEEDDTYYVVGMIDRDLQDGPHNFLKLSSLLPT